MTDRHGGGQVRPIVLAGGAPARGPLGRAASRLHGRGRAAAVVAIATAVTVGSLGAIAGSGSSGTARYHLTHAQLLAAERPYLTAPLDSSALTVPSGEAASLASAAQSASSAPAATGSTQTPSVVTTPGDAASTPTVAAPPTFLPEVQTVYQQIYTLAQQSSSAVPGDASGAGLEPPAQFDQALQGLTPQEVDLMYGAFQKVPQWQQLPAALAKAVGGLATPSPGSGSGTGAPAPAAAGGALVPHLALSGHSTQQYPEPDPATTTTFAPPTTTSVVSSSTCPTGAPGGNYGEDSIYAAQLAVDAFTVIDAVIPQALTIGFAVFGVGVTVTIPDPAWIIAQAALYAAEVIHDTYAYYQAIASDCQNADMLTELQATDASVEYLTTLVDQRTSALENQAELVYALEDSQTASVLDEVAVLQALANLQFKTVLAQDLITDTSGGVAEFEEPASIGGYLDALPIGVQAVVTQALQGAIASGELSNPAAKTDLSLANAALAAKQYKYAFSLYARTYREIVQ